MFAMRARTSRDEFYRRLGKLRSQIDSVPQQHRPALNAAADEAQEQYEQMRHTCAQIDDFVADLGLTLSHAQFHLAASWRECRSPGSNGRLTT